MQTRFLKMWRSNLREILGEKKRNPWVAFHKIITNILYFIKGSKDTSSMFLWATITINRTLWVSCYWPSVQIYFFLRCWPSLTLCPFHPLSQFTQTLVKDFEAKNNHYYFVIACIVYDLSMIAVYFGENDIIQNIQWNIKRLLFFIALHASRKRFLILVQIF